MQSSASPVTAQEIEIVKAILARMQAQGQSLSPEMWTSGTMADSSKRLRDSPDSPSSDGESVLTMSATGGMEGFEMIRDLLPSGGSSSQKPISPKIPQEQMPGLPEGVESVEKWGMTICSLPKVKEDSPTYVEIGTLAKYREYRNWVIQNGESKGARCVDLRNYLISSGVVSSGNQVAIPGTSEVRRYRE